MKTIIRGSIIRCVLCFFGGCLFLYGAQTLTHLPTILGIIMVILCIVSEESKWAKTLTIVGNKDREWIWTCPGCTCMNEDVDIDTKDEIICKGCGQKFKNKKD